MKYTIKQFKEEFKTDEDCMQYIIQARFGNKKLYPIKGRKSVYADSTGNQYSPLSGTIFEKSSTSLWNWFFVIFLFVNSKNGVSAKEIERQIGVTYKTAWRMAKQIRLGLANKNISLFGIVETDETYYGGKKKGKRGRGADGKTPVFGMVERGGNVKASVVPNVQTKTIQPIINKTISKGTTIMTDEYPIYNQLPKNGYVRKVVKHAIGEYVRGDVHTNNIEGFWSQLKRSIDGTHHAVSPKYLQTYVDLFVWYRNNRQASSPLFHLALKEVVRA